MDLSYFQHVASLAFVRRSWTLSPDMAMSNSPASTANDLSDGVLVLERSRRARCHLRPGTGRPAEEVSEKANRLPSHRGAQLLAGQPSQAASQGLDGKGPQEAEKIERVLVHSSVRLVDARRSCAASR